MRISSETDVGSKLSSISGVENLLLPTKSNFANIMQNDSGPGAEKVTKNKIELESNIKGSNNKLDAHHKFAISESGNEKNVDKSKIVNLNKKFNRENQCIDNKLNNIEQSSDNQENTKDDSSLITKEGSECFLVATLNTKLDNIPDLQMELLQQQSKLANLEHIQDLNINVDVNLIVKAENFNDNIKNMQDINFQDIDHLAVNNHFTNSQQDKTDEIKNNTISDNFGFNIFDAEAVVDPETILSNIKLDLNQNNLLQTNLNKAQLNAPNLSDQENYKQSENSDLSLLEQQIDCNTDDIQHEVDINKSKMSTVTESLSQSKDLGKILASTNSDIAIVKPNDILNNLQVDLNTQILNQDDLHISSNLTTNLNHSINNTSLLTKNIMNQSVDLQQPLQIKDPGWQNNLGQRIAWMIKDNISSAVIKVNPPELGELNLKLDLAKDNMHIVFTTNHVKSYETMQHAIPSIKELFADQSLSVQVDVHNNSNYQFNNNDHKDFNSDNGKTMLAYGSDNDNIDNISEKLQQHEKVNNAQIIDYYA